MDDSDTACNLLHSVHEYIAAIIHAMIRGVIVCSMKTMICWFVYHIS
ncbi:hypothetical protein HMPREF1584_01343 [Gardnerella vaginalis JCP8481A]|uniref:Uncharacterized protein n=1 Tax=Gardnerella vaginalis TaxID=2702 RepID=A0A133P383_GARVA|nr:hypothetical protein HMPREF1584_01343 [Gardnerella vaginalis JCP8481A]EPI44102.1 hypothetical protein HMPREF1585_00249 [Gardnerella vaginalis JCP8481B]KXA23038.1 hypothetical protein HMPREF3208_00013 [Gardnerella vaginalis]